MSKNLCLSNRYTNLFSRKNLIKVGYISCVIEIPMTSIFTNFHFFIKLATICVFDISIPTKRVKVAAPPNPLTRLLVSHQKVPLYVSMYL